MIAAYFCRAAGELGGLIRDAEICDELVLGKPLAWTGLDSLRGVHDDPAELTGVVPVI